MTFADAAQPCSDAMGWPSAIVLVALILAGAYAWGKLLE